MDPTELIVVLASIAAIAWVNWHFFVAGRPRIAATAGVVRPGVVGSDATAPTEVVIVVDGGYAPNAVLATAGRPLRLVFDRRDRNPCSDEVVIADFGVRRFLPTGERTTIEITPTAAGRHDFTCGMSMLRGTIIVED